MKIPNSINWIIALLAAMGTSQAALVAHWTFDADASDSSGNGLDGTLKGNAAISTVSKVGGGSLYCASDGDYAEILGNSNITVPTHLPTGAADRTIAFFMKMEVDPTDTSPTMLSYGNAPSVPNGARFDILLDSSGKLRFESSGPPSGTFTPGYTESYSGNWVHVAMTYSQSEGILEAFVDGVSVGTRTGVINTGGNTATPDHAFTLNIGNSANDSLRNFQGYLDDVRIYDTVLSGTELQGLASIPEPAVSGLAGLGVLGLFLRRRRS